MSKQLIPIPWQEYYFSTEGIFQHVYQLYGLPSIFAKHLASHKYILATTHNIATIQYNIKPFSLYAQSYAIR